MFRTILVATDLTSQSASALVHAREFGRIFDSELIVAHVVPMPTALKNWKAAVFRDDLRAYREVLDRQRSSADDALNRQVSTIGLVSPKGVWCVVRAGDPAAQLAAMIEEFGVDLTIVGRGRGGKVGPVTERLVRLVGKAILVTPVRPSKLVAIGRTNRRISRRAAA